ncbi:MAG: hypothetical protein ABSA67_07745 [Candidatus Brocadiia bacterium]
MADGGCKRIILLLALAAAAAAIPAGCHRQPVPAAAPKAAEITGPFTRLFDTGVALSGPLTAAGLSASEGWAAVAEDVTTHSFAGDAVVVNDKLALVVSPNGAGASLYSRSGQGLRLRAVLAPVGDGVEMTLAGLRISENSFAAVALECAFKSKAGSTAAVAYRLTTGANLVEVRPGKGAERLRIEQEIKHVVVPDYFADDVVVSAGSSGRSRVGLPAENCLVNLTGEGDAITACVWKYGQADVDAIMEGTGEKASFQGVEIECAPGKSLWVALLEGPGIWHSRKIAVGETGEVELAWRRPFAAQWRCDAAGSDGLAHSSSFADAPGASADAARCWFDRERAFVRFVRPSPAETSATASAGETTLVVYPIDRSPATPLTAFCINDVMRSALGTGPCQYVLEAEGMGTEYPATPDLVSRWMEEQFRKGKLKKESAALRERLGRMTRHIEEVQGRIRDYGKLADSIQSACADPGPNGPLAQEVLKLLGEMRRAVGEDENIHRSAEQVTQEVLALAEKECGADEWQQEMVKVRALGATQDSSLARCRMILRQVIQLCRGAQGTAANFADTVKKLAQSGLRKEAPIHKERNDGSE